MGQALKAVTQDDLSGGVNAVTAPHALGKKQSLRVINLILDEHASLRTVDGTLIQTQAPASEAGKRIVLPISWTSSAGQTRHFVTTRPDTGQSIFWQWDSFPWAQIGTFDSNQVTPEKIIFVDLVIQTDAYTVPKKYDGTTFAALGGGLVGAQHIVLHQGFAWVGNTAQFTTATDGSTALRQSDLNNPQSWPLAFIAFISKDDGQPLTGFGTFTIVESGISPTNVLIVFKSQSTFQVFSNFGDITNFAIQKIKSDMGCFAAQSVQFCSGFGIIRLSHRGFTMYDGVNDLLLSEEIRPYLFGRDDIQGIDWGNANVAWADQSTNPPLYLCFCPTTTGTQMTRCFAYDLVRKAWTVLDLPFPIASIRLLVEPNQLPRLLITDAPNAGVVGTIRRWFAGDVSFDCQPVCWVWRTRPGFYGDHFRFSYFRRAVVDVLAMQGQVINIAGTFGNITSSAVPTVKFVATSGGGIWGRDAWGTFKWGGNAGTTLIEQMLPVELGVLAPNGFLELTGCGQVRFRGIRWDIKPKALNSVRF